MVSYIGVIDGGGAFGPAAGFDGFRVHSLEFIAWQGLPGASSSSLVWFRAGSAVWGELRCSPRCLTIASEERETWAAGSLRPGFGRAWRESAARELHRRSRFQIHRAFCFGFGRGFERVCLGLVETFGLLDMVLGSDGIVISRDRSLELQLESLILAQNERWRQA